MKVCQWKSMKWKEQLIKWSRSYMKNWLKVLRIMIMKLWCSIISWH